MGAIFVPHIPSSYKFPQQERLTGILKVLLLVLKVDLSSTRIGLWWIAWCSI